MSPKSSTDLGSMSLEQLEAEQLRLSAERADLHERQVAVAAALDVATANEAARRKLETLTDVEKSALLQQLSADGIATDTKHGRPGGRS